MLIKRINKYNSSDLKTIFRPCTIAELLGNQELKRVLKNNIQKDKLSHTMLFSGPAGTGKTTVARALALALNCEESEYPTITPCLKCGSCVSILEQNSLDYTEINVASAGGKDAVGNLVKDLQLAPFKNRYKILVFDECQALTTAAKALLLKVMEDANAHCYIIFCTNQPEKLGSVTKKEGNPFLDRCDHFVLKPLVESETQEALENISQFMGYDYTTEVLNYIVELSKGIPRKAIGSLAIAAADGSWDINNIKSLLGNELIGEDDAEIIELSRTLLKAQYGNSVKLFEKLVKKYPVESIRVAVCGYVVSCLKRSRSLNEGSRFSMAIDILLPSIYTDNKPAQHDFYNRIFKVVKTLQN